MARRWTPQRLVSLRRIRVATCITAVTVSMLGMFAFTAHKSVALSINGETRTVSTFAMTTERLLEEQGVDVKTHDLVETSSGDWLADHAVVTVRSAYQTTIVIDGMSVPFWTVATSAEQLLGFFEENEHSAAKVTVDIGNVYSQLTGGLVINEDGPVTVIADGKRSIAPNGKLPAASILDSKGIVPGKEDRISVEKHGAETILRVQRVTHGTQTRTVSVPFSTVTIVDPNLAPGQTELRQQGANGEKTQVYDVTYVDGAAESETLASETVTTMATDQIIAVGPASGSNDTGSDASTDTDTNQSATNGNHATNGGTGESNNTGTDNTNTANNSKGDSKADNGNTDSSATGNTGTSGDSNTSGNDSGNANGTGNAGNTDSAGKNNNTGATPSGRLWHPTPAQAQAYAAGAAAQRGWTGNEWTCLYKLWMRESSWQWDAENASSGAYGIPQSLPADNMAMFGANWRDDAAVQIDWGLYYIANKYGTPSKAWEQSEQIGWY